MPKMEPNCQNNVPKYWFLQFHCYYYVIRFFRNCILFVMQLYNMSRPVCMHLRVTKLHACSNILLYVKEISFVYSRRAMYLYEIMFQIGQNICRNPENVGRNLQERMSYMRVMIYIRVSNKAEHQLKTVQKWMDHHLMMMLTMMTFSLEKCVLWFMEFIRLPPAK